MVCSYAYSADAVEYVRPCRNPNCPGFLRNGRRGFGQTVPKRHQVIDLVLDGPIGGKSGVVHVAPQIPGIQFCVLSMRPQDLSAGWSGGPQICLFWIEGHSHQVTKLRKCFNGLDGFQCIAAYHFPVIYIAPHAHCGIAVVHPQFNCDVGNGHGYN